MKIHMIKDMSMLVPPFKATLEDIWEQHKNHFVEFPSGEIGFLIKPSIAVVARYITKVGVEGTVKCGDGSSSFAHCLGDTKLFGIGAYYVKHTPVCETLTYRTKPLDLDTFLFRLDPVNNSIRCSKFVHHELPPNARIDYTDHSDFLPVVDRWGHFIGLTIGKHDGVFICVDSHELTTILNQ